MVAFLGLLIAAGTWLWYLRLIPGERVPDRPVVHQALMGASLLFGAVGLVAGGGEAIIGVAAMILSAYFFFLIANALLPPGEITVSVGDRLPDFAALDDDGAPVESQSWRGRRVLLKFYRGSW